MTILCYHEVDPTWDSPMAMRPEAFAEHCEWLARHKTVLPLGAAVAQIERRGRLGRGCVALTLDDGFSGLYTHALPVLSRLSIPATVFLVAQTLTETGRPVDWVDDPPETPLRTLTAEQVAEMQTAGVRFESHSFTHADLTSLSFEDCVNDLRQSRELLESVLGHPVRQLAYPRGRHNDAVRAAAERAGYTHAFTLPEKKEPSGPWAIPRVGIYRGNDVARLRYKSSGVYLGVRTSPAWSWANRAAGVLRRRRDERRP